MTDTIMPPVPPGEILLKEFRTTGPTGLRDLTRH